MRTDAAGKRELFESVPVPKALLKMAVPTIISQAVNLIYNMVDTFFIGRTGNSLMVAATTVTLTIVMLNVAFANLFGTGGGSLISRLMGAGRDAESRSVGAFSVWCAAALALTYSAILGIFLEPILYFLGASSDTIVFAKQYTLIVSVAGSLPAILSMVLANLLRSAGYSGVSGAGLSIGGVLNMILDPLFMFVIFEPGNEVTGAAVATLISNVVSLVFLFAAYVIVSRKSPLSFSLREAFRIKRENLKALFSVGIPAAVLTGLFDVASICVNILAAAHGDLVLAGMGIVMKVERIPNAVNIGICQGMLPIVAYNYSSGNTERMKETIRTARIAGLAVSALSIAALEIFAGPVTGVFLSITPGEAANAALTLGYAALFLRIRCLAAPVQFINYHSSFCMQAMGYGRGTMLHASVRELVFYIPLMFLLDGLFGQNGLASALPAGEALGAVFALFLLYRFLRRTRGKDSLPEDGKL